MKERFITFSWLASSSLFFFGVLVWAFSRLSQWWKAPEGWYKSK